MFPSHDRGGGEMNCTRCGGDNGVFLLTSFACNDCSPVEQVQGRVIKESEDRPFGSGGWRITGQHTAEHQAGVKKSYSPLLPGAIEALKYGWKIQINAWWTVARTKESFIRLTYGDEIYVSNPEIYPGAFTHSSLDGLCVGNLPWRLYE